MFELSFCCNRFVRLWLWLRFKGVSDGFFWINFQQLSLVWQSLSVCTFTCMHMYSFRIIAYISKSHIKLSKCTHIHNLSISTFWRSIVIVSFHDLNNETPFSLFGLLNDVVVCVSYIWEYIYVIRQCIHMMTIMISVLFRFGCFIMKKPPKNLRILQCRLLNGVYVCMYACVR